MLQAIQDTTETTAEMRVVQCQCGEARFLVSGRFACWENCPHCGYFQLLAFSSCQQLMISREIENAA
jgi:hypothetical protein